MVGFHFRSEILHLHDIHQNRVRGPEDLQDRAERLSGLQELHTTQGPEAHLELLARFLSGSHQRLKPDFNALGGADQHNPAPAVPDGTGVHGFQRRTLSGADKLSRNQLLHDAQPVPLPEQRGPGVAGVHNQEKRVGHGQPQQGVWRFRSWASSWST
ncbi:MAG: hypothetical protein CL923_09180 [Deltaproteobacteria bacterium]|nr:hypothetical protein [Deltaproteobacteria bacterium]